MILVTFRQPCRGEYARIWFSTDYTVYSTLPRTHDFGYVSAYRYVLYPKASDQQLTHV
jgi:hypothetical protein